MILGMRQSPAASPVVQSNFALSANDFDSLSSTSTMPTGGSISRAGNAMLYAVDGGVAKLTYAPNNLVLQSNTFDTTPWINNGVPAPTANATTAPDATNTAWKIIANTNLSLHGVYEPVSAISATTYVASAYFKAAGEITASIVISNSPFPRAKFDLSAGTVTSSAGGGTGSITSVGNGWYRCSVVFSAPSSTLNVSLYIRDADAFWSGNNTDGIFVWNSQLEAVTYQTTPSTYVATTTSAYYGPRFDYDPVTLQPKGLLVEGTRTNLGPYSCVPGSWPTAAGLTVNSTNNAAPDGTNTASNITLTSAGYLYEPNYNPGNGTYTVTASAWLSGTAGTKIAFRVQDAATGTGGGNQIVTLTTTPTRYTFTVTVVVTGGSGIMHGFDNRVGVVPGLPNVAATFTMWGYQFEVGAFATSFIYTPNSNTTATRAAETFSLTGYANRLVEAFYIDEQTGANFSGNSTVVASGDTTISPPTFGWVTSLRAYTNAYAGSISTPSWLSFSGTTGTTAGNRTYYDSTGTLTWAPANLLTYSDFTAGWSQTNTVITTPGNVTAPDNTNTAALYSPTAGANNLAFQNLTMPSNGVGSVYVKSNGASFFFIRLFDGTNTYYTWFNLTNGTVGTNQNSKASIISVGNNWYRCSVANTVLAASGNFLIGVCDSDGGGQVASASSKVYIWGAQLERVTYQTAPSAYIPTTSAAVYGPRYDYDPSTVPATPRGLLIEESRANLLAYSNALNNTSVWVSTITSIAASPNISPDGTTNALTLTIPSVANKYVYQGYAISVTGNATASIWARVTSGTGKVYLSLYDGPSTITTTTCNLTPQWQRFTVTRGQTSGNTGYFVVGQTSTSTDASPSVEVFGAQLEAGSFATSYIPTTTASVTRAADVAQLTGSALTTLQGTQMTLAAEAVSSVATNRYLINARKISGSNYGDYYSLGSLASSLNVATVNQATLTYSPAPTTTSIFRAAFAIQANNFAAVANSGTVQTDGTGSIVTGIDQGWLGGYSDGVYLNGCVRSMALYNTRLPDAILKQKSSVGAPY